MKALYEVRSNKLDILSPLLHVTRLKMVVVFCGLSLRTEGESVSFLARWIRTSTVFAKVFNLGFFVFLYQDAF